MRRKDFPVPDVLRRSYCSRVKFLFSNLRRPIENEIMMWVDGRWRQSDVNVKLIFLVGENSAFGNLSAYNLVIEKFHYCMLSNNMLSLICIAYFEKKLKIELI